MKKIIKENLFEFTRNSNPLDTLGIGYVAKIYKFFDDLKISRHRYIIEGKQIIFKNSLDLKNYTDLVKLPDNLTINGWLDLQGCTNLVELPNNLIISSWLYLEQCISLTKLSDNLKIGDFLDLTACNSLKELPDNLIVYDVIYVNENQKELIKWIKSSNFKNQLRLN